MIEIHPNFECYLRIPLSPNLAHLMIEKSNEIDWVKVIQEFLNEKYGELIIQELKQ